MLCQEAMPFLCNVVCSCTAPLSWCCSLSAVLLPQAAPSNSTSGICNADMPNTSVYTRFLYVVKVSPLKAATLGCEGVPLTRPYNR